MIRRWAPLVLAAALQGCGSFPRMVRHADPLSPDQHVQLGIAYAAQGLKEDARRQFDAALRLQKGHVPALLAHGNLAFEGKDLRTAAKHYRRVLKWEKDHPIAANNLAMVYLERGEKLDEAALLAEAAFRRGGPSKPYALETLASIYLRQGRLEQARRVLDEAGASAVGDAALSAQLAETRKKLSESR